MLKVALAGLRINKVRLVLTSLAIVIGVAFVSGSFVFTDTINARFDSLLGDISAGTDVYVRAVDPEFGNDFGQLILSMPEETLDAVAGVEGVDEAEAPVDGFAQLIGADGEPIGGQGPPTIATSWMESSTLSPVQIRDGNGRAPESGGEVVIDVGTANANDFTVGQQVGIIFNGPVETFEIVGLASFGEEDNLAGATLVIFEFAETQRVLSLEGKISSIAVSGTSDVTPDELVTRIEPVLPDDVLAITVDDANAEQSAEIGEALSFLTIGLLAFAAIAVFVGAFIISNTFRITIAQRTRELALLRAVGATGGQVTRMVVLEAFVIALVSSIVGVIGGVLLAVGLQTVLRAAGAGLPDGPLTILVRTVVVGMAVGVIVTIISALLPARKAARIPPVAAMTEVLSAPTRRSLSTRAIWGAVITAVGVLALGAGLFTSIPNAIWFVAIGALAVFIGISVLAPLGAGPITSVIGWPLPRLFGVPGDLAVQNTKRQPRRTASTASALMIGVALVVFVAIFGASIKASVAEALGDVFPADLTISSSNFTAGVSPQFTEELSQAPEIGAVTSIGFTQVRVDQDVVESVTAVEPDTVASLLRLGASDEDLATMGAENGLLVNVQSEGFADEIGLTYDVEMPNGATAPGTVVGTFDDGTRGRERLPRGGECRRGRPRRGGQGCSPGDRRALPDHRDPDNVRGAVRRGNPDRPVAGHLLGAARPRHHHRRPRNHQHPRIEHHRANSRDRTASGRRHGQAPGASDDPLGGRTHRDLRCHPRYRSRHPPRMGRGAGTRRPGSRDVLDSVGPAARVHPHRCHRRRDRCDLPGTQGVTAQHPRGHRLRMRIRRRRSIRRHGRPCTC
jgi:putative ABC transport system permease protein